MCEKLLLTVPEAAHMLAIKRSLTYRLIQTGELRSVKVAGARRLLATDVQDFVQRLKERSSDVCDP
jgi:excisionase family DNA binding protein